MVLFGTWLTLSTVAFGVLVLLDTIVHLIERLAKSPKNWLPVEGDDDKSKTGGSKESSCSVVYATQTGTAETFARSLKSQMEGIFGEHNDIFLRDAQHYPLEKIAKENLVVFIVATYGEGGPTDSAEDLYSWLKRVEGGQDSNMLSGVNYSVFGLGNSQYERFCEMGKLLDRCLKKLGATPVARLGLGDAFHDTQLDFEEWSQDFLSCVQISSILRSGKEMEVSAATVSSYSIRPVNVSEAVDKLPSGDGRSKENSFLAPITMAQEMCKEGERHCLHLEFDVAESGISYEVGDHVGVYGANSADTVSKMAEILGLPLDYTFTMQKDPKYQDLQEPFSVQPITLGFALTHYVDILSSPSKGALRALSAFIEDEDQKKSILYLSQQDGFQQYQDMISKQKSLLEVMQGVPSAKPTLGAFLGSIAPRLRPRYYSISSSPMIYPHSVHVTCAVVKDITPGGRIHHGIASGYLQRCAVGDRVRLYHRSSVFKLPRSGFECPLVMVGPGTGIAPFMGFIQERQSAMERGTQVGDAILFFGCRHRDHDYLYRQKLEEALQTGSLSKLFVAFSRETPKKVYVQDKILENRDVIWDLLFKKNGHLYICGASKMSDDVINALTEIVRQEKHCSLEEAQAIFSETLVSQKRLSKDVW